MEVSNRTLTEFAQLGRGDRMRRCSFNELTHTPEKTFIHLNLDCSNFEVIRTVKSTSRNCLPAIAATLARKQTRACYKKKEVMLFRTRNVKPSCVRQIKTRVESANRPADRKHKISFE